MRTQVLTWTLVIVLSMTLGGAAVVALDQLRSDEAPATVVREAAPSTTTPLSSDAPRDLADLYARVRPSIVTVSGLSSRTNVGGTGSGIIIDKQGHILTNNHVVRGFDIIDVTLFDLSSYAATVVGTDPGNDLAVIKINAPPDKLQPAILGDSDQVRIGELVIAVGNPLNLTGSVTQGIVSGVGRTLGSGGTGRPLRQLIQSDAAINPGNSGGGLFNMNGEVIGITTAIDNPDGERAFVGIGYSVPINIAKRFLPDLLAGKTIRHPKMGVGLETLTPARAAQFGLSVDRGVMVVSVEPNSAAARAGLRGIGGGTGSRTPGDVILSIDGHEMKTFEDLAKYIDSRSVGDTIEIRLLRENREITVRLTLEAWQG
ncbi:MAG TPA: trypsin-like peptidase domain-containing protein [Dehalococcoidia bacterium]|nr:trypsin-like peptidase domain-containing protein [Dehalococcoidia bacterium]